MFSLYTVVGCGYVPTKTTAFAGTREDTPLNFSVANKGVQVIGAYTINQPSNGPAKYSIRCVSTAGSRQLINLVDLDGMVHIKNAKDALIFVRLRTSLSTYGYWPGDWVVEIVKVSEKMPQFGPSGPDSTGSLFGPPVPGEGKGTGVLDDDEFARLGYSVPTVSLMGSKFVVNRWLLVCSPDNSYPEYVEKVREYVGSDGDYTITILKKEDVPVNLLSGPRDFEWHFTKPSLDYDIS
jgi:hypothetical protein